MIHRLLALAPCLAAAFLAIAPPLARAQPGEKVLRYAFEIAETSFDPQHVADVYSNIVNQGMFETPLTYDYLARPLKLTPQTAASMPEIGDGGRTEAPQQQRPAVEPQERVVGRVLEGVRQRRRGQRAERRRVGAPGLRRVGREQALLHRAQAGDGQAF